MQPQSMEPLMGVLAPHCTCETNSSKQQFAVRSRYVEFEDVGSTANCLESGVSLIYICRQPSGA